MSIKLYMDVHIPSAITEGLREKGVDVLTAQEDGKRLLPDPALLDRAAELGRLMFSQDGDMLREANRRQRSGIAFGVVYARQRYISIGEAITHLEIIATHGQADEYADKIEFLPWP